MNSFASFADYRQQLWSHGSFLNENLHLKTLLLGYELLQELDILRPEYNTNKVVTDSTEEATDDDPDNSPDPDTQDEIKLSKSLKKREN